MKKYKIVTIKYSLPMQIYEIYKSKYEKDYQLIGYRAKDGKATLTLYPRKEGEKNVQ